MRAWSAVALVILAASVAFAAGALFDSGESGAGGVYAQSEAVQCWRVSGDAGPYAVNVLVCPEMVPAPVQPTPSSTAPPTNTPRPSLTPQTPATATRTPSATSTPVQTLTPTATATAPFSSPTPESTLASTSTPAPIPTDAPTPTPLPGACQFTPASGLRVRAAVWGDVIAQFGPVEDASATPPRVAVQTIRAEARARDSDGAQWIAFWLSQGVYAWVHGGYVTLSGDCAGLPEQPQALLVGPHMLYNANAWSLSDYLQSAGIAKEVSGRGALLTYARMVNPVISTVYRTTELGDCAPDHLTGAQWLDALVTIWPPGIQWYEPLNECGGLAAHSYSNAFTIDLMRRANERGYCLLLYSFSVGWPSVEDFAAMRPALDYALAHPCQPGRRHGLALHAYGVGYPRENTYLFSRWRRLCVDDMAAYCDALGIYYTEWEHYEKEADPVDCSRVVDNVRWARAAYKNSPVRAVLLWNFGALAPWRDLTPCAGAIAG